MTHHGPERVATSPAWASTEYGPADAGRSHLHPKREAIGEAIGRRLRHDRRPFGMPVPKCLPSIGSLPRPVDAWSGIQVIPPLNPILSRCSWPVRPAPKLVFAKAWVLGVHPTRMGTEPASRLIRSAPPAPPPPVPESWACARSAPSCARTPH